MPKFRIAPLLLLLLMPAVPAFGQTQLPPLDISKARQYPACPGQPGASKERVQALDISQPADDKFLDEAWNGGVRTIFRYCDWEGGKNTTGDACQFGDRTQVDRRFDFAWKPGPTIIGKALTAQERDRLATFADSRRGEYDAERALESARQLAQPKSTTIFFGVDLDITPTTIVDVKRYFHTLVRVVKPHGYNIGVYGSGFTCTVLKKEGLAEFCWLSQSTAFQESLHYEKGSQWDLKQCAARKPFAGSRIAFDTNIFGSRGANIGLWRPK